MKISLCNEVSALGDDRQAGFCCKTLLGYDGLEIAPSRLNEMAHQLLDADALAKIRSQGFFESEGIAFSGLHWLLVAPDGCPIHGC